MNAIYPMIIPAVWLTLFGYWIVSSFNVKRTVRREPIRFRLLYTAPGILGAIFLIRHRSESSLLAHQIWPQTFVSFWLGVVVMALGLAFAIWARATIGRNWSGTVTMKESHELVQTGPYALMRHPIYTGILLMVLGTAIAIGQWRALLAVLLVLISFRIKLQLEEKYMVELFGPAYVAYRQRVAMLIPGLW
jgi:protein-S-isoprenylcysteine O-methyltransferase Ste14